MTQDKKRPPADKRPYRAPRLAAYGDVRAITQTIANTGNLDTSDPRARLRNTGDTG